jgi:hypothetical protein
MTARKKATPVPVPPPKKQRFEIGYTFPVLAEIIDIHYDDYDNPEFYEVVVELECGESGTSLSDSGRFSMEALIDIESVCNPNAKKEHLNQKIKVAEAELRALQAKLNELG